MNKSWMLTWSHKRKHQLRDLNILSQKNYHKLRLQAVWRQQYLTVLVKSSVYFKQKLGLLAAVLWEALSIKGLWLFDWLIVTYLVIYSRSAFFQIDDAFNLFLKVKEIEEGGVMWMHWIAHGKNRRDHENKNTKNTK